MATKNGPVKVSDVKPKNPSFKKRKDCIKKKTMELSVLCDVKACALIIGPDGKLETWPELSHDVLEVLRAFQNSNSKDSKRMKKVAEDRNEVALIELPVPEDQWLRGISGAVREEEQGLPSTSNAVHEKEQQRFPLTVWKVADQEEQGLPSTSNAVREKEQQRFPLTVWKVADQEEQGLPSTSNAVHEKEQQRFPLAVWKVADQEEQGLPSTSNAVHEKEQQRFPLTVWKVADQEQHGLPEMLNCYHQEEQRCPRMLNATDEKKVRSEHEMNEWFNEKEMGSENEMNEWFNLEDYLDDSIALDQPEFDAWMNMDLVCYDDHHTLVNL